MQFFSDAQAFKIDASGFNPQIPFYLSTSVVSAILLIPKDVSIGT